LHAELAALDGARAGEVRLARKDFATLGRHPSADIGFDPEHDLDATAAGADGLVTALNEARADAARLRKAITESNPDRLAELSRDVTTSRARHEGVARAAELDASVARARLPAVALVVAELPGGRRLSGTGLTGRARGDTGWILTSRHLVVDSAGRPARRLGALYHGTAQNFRAWVAATADSADLALLVVLVRGGVPEAAAIATGAAAGDPVSVLGYPFGFAFPMAGDWRKVGVSATTFSGTVTRVTAHAVEIDGFGATGSSGSPVLDAAGAVVGMVFGGDPRSHGRTLYAVPASVIMAFLAQHGLK
jgi:hypothetical protein